MPDAGNDDAVEPMSCDEEEYDLNFSGESSNSDTNVDLENQYFQAKGLKEKKNFQEALSAFEGVLKLEGENKGIWGFKALKNIVKIHYDLHSFDKLVDAYEQLLTYTDRAVTNNEADEVITSIYDYIVEMLDINLMQEIYEMTINALKGKKSITWFKTNVRLAELLIETAQLNMANKKKLPLVIRELHKSCKNEKGEDDLDNKSRELMEVYALQMQMHDLYKDNLTIKKIYGKALSIKGDHRPKVLGIIRECGGKMHMRSENFNKAKRDFLLAFKHYDLINSPLRLRALKYLILPCMMEHNSSMDMFDAPEVQPYIHEDEIEVLGDLALAVQENDPKQFFLIYSDHKDIIMNDPFVEEFVEISVHYFISEKLTSVANLRSQVIFLFILCLELNVSLEEVETHIARNILDKNVHGRLIRNKLLILEQDETNSQDLQKQYNDMLIRASDKLDDLFEKLELSKPMPITRENFYNASLNVKQPNLFIYAMLEIFRRKFNEWGIPVDPKQIRSAQHYFICT